MSYVVIVTIACLTKIFVLHLWIFSDNEVLYLA